MERSDNHQMLDKKNKNDESEKLSLVSNYRVIDNSYLYFKKFVIGSGSFGKVLYGMNYERTKECAIKFEKSTVKNSVIDEEISILNDLKGGLGIPKIEWSGIHEDYKIMVMELLGPSLDKYFKICHKQFSLDTTIQLGIEMVKRIEYVHSKGYLHRDIKPNNFLLGKFSREMSIDNTLYIIDFGLSKSFLDPDTNKHYSLKDDRRFVGTPRYAGLNTHLGVRQSRRDDLESIMFILIYFLKSELPWQGVKAKTKSEKKRKIMRKKKAVNNIDLCENLPKEFNICLDYIREIKFDEKPNYKYICSLLLRVRDENTRSDLEWNVMFMSSKSLLKEINSNGSQLGEGDNNINGNSGNNGPYGMHALNGSISSSEREMKISRLNKFKKYYQKLYEGYPIPSYEEFLSIIDKEMNTCNMISMGIDDMDDSSIDKYGSGENKIDYNLNINSFGNTGGNSNLRSTFNNTNNNSNPINNLKG